MVFASFPSDAPWHELDLLAARAEVSVEYLCSTVEAALEFAQVEVNASKGATDLFYPTYDDDFEQVVRVLWDDDFELAIKEIPWHESEHPREENGRFANAGGAQAHADFPYGAVIPPRHYVPPTKQLSASEARDELKRQNERLITARRPIEVKINRARRLLKELEAQQTSDRDQQAVLHNKMKEVARQVQSHQIAIKAAEREHTAWLRQLLYVTDPTRVEVRFNARRGYAPLQTQHQKDAALTGAEEVRRMVSAKVTVGDLFFEHEKRTKVRSNFRGNQRIGLTEDAGTRVVVHEAGHSIEHLNPQIKQKAIAFRNSRTQGESAIPLSTLDPEYGAGEITRKDRFLNPYMGKIYPGNRDTEIITMGLECFYSDPVKLATEDSEYFDFIYNTLRGN